MSEPRLANLAGTSRLIGRCAELGDMAERSHPSRGRQVRIRAFAAQSDRAEAAVKIAGLQCKRLETRMETFPGVLQSGHTTVRDIVVDGGYTHLDRTLT